MTMSVTHLTAKDATYSRYQDKEVFLGDVLDDSKSAGMSVGYYFNLNKGENNEWIVTYDEVLVVTRGALTIRYDGGSKTARQGEIIFITKGTKIAYEAGEDDTQAVYVSYPHWLKAQQGSEHAHYLQRVKSAPEFSPEG
jgi:ethanolamine utilization protein EutQ